MKIPRFDYACPSTLAEAVKLLASRDGEAKVLAGGQSLMPLLAFRMTSPQLLVDLRKVPSLNSISISADGVRLGAMVRWRDIERHPQLGAAHPLLVAAIDHVAHYQIRNRGTVGGSLAHADPSAEMPGLAVACDARISVAGPAGTREIEARDFFVGPLTTVLEPDEIIVEISLPVWPSGRKWAFEEFAIRRGDFALAGVAVFYDVDASGLATNVHIGIIGVCDRPTRVAEAEALLEGKTLDEASLTAAAAAMADIADAADDFHASANYRRALLTTLTERALRRAAA
jgi:carbon-monoxide dehydrogenase medium subunit